MDLNVIITTNGPGELATWVIPVVEILRSKLPNARPIIALVPCPHSSGQEERIASQIYGASVMKPKETIQFILTGKLPPHIVLSKIGSVLHLGGDQLFSVGIGWRTKFPVLMYTEDKILWPHFVDKYLLRDSRNFLKHQKKGISTHKMSVVGDLMADAVKPTLSPLKVREKLKLSHDKPVVALLPGSKPLKVLYSTSFLLKVANEVRFMMPDTQFILPQSSFTPLSQLRNAIQEDEYIKVLDGERGRIVYNNSGTFIESEEGTKITIVPASWHYNALQIADVSITLPGTNTSELAALGIPMVVILPLNKPHLIPVDGLIGALSKLPGFGRVIKPKVIKFLLKKLKYVALPNQKANRMIVPEIIGQVSAYSVARKTISLLQDPLYRRQVSMELRQTIDSEGTVMQILTHLLLSMKKQYPELNQIFDENSMYRTNV